MVSVVMEKSCRNPRDWTGAVGGKLGGLLYVDLCDDANFDGGITHLTTEILKVTADERVGPAGGAQAADSGAGAIGAIGAIGAVGTVGAAATPPPLPHASDDAATSHGAPRKLSSDPEVQRAREHAISLGLVTLLESAEVPASTTQLAAGAALCEAVGASSVEEVARYGKGDELLAALELKPIQLAKTREALEKLAPEPLPRSGGCCLIA